MDDPGWSWPAWKFGMRQDDLFTKLHDQYNTFASSIQDPEAFHADVSDISHKAASAEEFHRLMADRKEQRLRELDESLESASVEIIANPSLIGTTQWQYALQLFRTKSLDSLVRYFSSYLPADHPWHRLNESADESDASDSDTYSVESSVFDEKPLTRQPYGVPPSPQSMTACFDSVTSSSDLAHHDYELNELQPGRTLSFSESGSESEPEHFGQDSCPQLHEDSASQPSDADTPVSSVSDPSETHRAEYLVITTEVHGEVVVADHDEFLASEPPTDDMESETPTPKPDNAVSCFFDSKLSAVPSPSRHVAESRKSQRSSRLRQAERSPVGKGRRRSPGVPTSRVQKPLPDPIRWRPQGRRRVDC